MVQIQNASGYGSALACDGSALACDESAGRSSPGRSCLKHLYKEDAEAAARAAKDASRQSSPTGGALLLGWDGLLDVDDDDLPYFAIKLVTIEYYWT